ncbi:GroES-like protein [Cristinia sonorae]|uniref:GroES-like protein n=1 Tax=Cristinia sonorae TaxID=1940300 RepID=A0A8K0UIU5_9AGAR|nr:GroES-like protein [Cristinia sonorae]
MTVSHPTSYTAYAFTEKGGDLEKVTKQWKDPEQNQVVVKVLACGVCGSDVLVENQRLGSGLPKVPGHEIVGDVVAVHSSERQFKIGDRVGSGWHGSHCGTCKFCRSGDFNVCENEEIDGVTIDGGYAQYVTLRTEAVAWIPKDLDPAETAPLLCAGVTTFNSLRNMDAKPGDLVAIQGIGGLGHLAIQFSRAMGFRTVALSHSEAKKDLARQLGAIAYIDSSKQDTVEELQKMGGAKVIMCTAPHTKVIEGLIPGLTVAGQLLMLALPEEKATIDLSALITKRLSIRGWPSGSAKDSEECVAFAKQMGIKCMVQKFPLDKAREAYEHRDSARFRGVIVPN